MPVRPGEAESFPGPIPARPIDQMRHSHHTQSTPESRALPGPGRSQGGPIRTDGTRTRSPESVGSVFPGVILAVLMSVGLAASMPPSEARAQVADGAVAVPFQPGESLEYRVSSSRFGTVGAGSMTVSGPVRIRDRSTFLLTMELRGKVAFFDFEDVTRSWFDPGSMASLRYTKAEDHPFGEVSEEVEVYPEEGRWTDGDGREGSLITKRPLDELSMIYLLRTLELGTSSKVTLSRHFDPERNPVRIAYLGIEEVSVPAGTFDARVYEMTVRDERRFGAEGKRIRIHLTDDPARLPLRIESGAPGLGNAVLELEYAHTAARLAEGRESAVSIERSNR